MNLIKVLYDTADKFSKRNKNIKSYSVTYIILAVMTLMIFLSQIVYLVVFQRPFQDKCFRSILVVVMNFLYAIQIDHIIEKSNFSDIHPTTIEGLYISTTYEP